MKKVNFGSTGKQVPAIVMGCMRMKELTVKEAAKLVDAAMAEQGLAEVGKKRFF